MSLLSSRAASLRGPSGSLCAPLALLLLLLTAPGPLASAGPVSVVLKELRCTCLHVMPRVNAKMISNLQVFPAGPQCSKVEVIASLKDGTQVCLDPEAPFLKKVIQKILGSGNKKNE
ncbi:C-X-C motif chemokine 6 [Callithrix jacchus]|uniref:C-X-C motif chemokine n=1 Tax=Callithrix jacchus TaxID=9483 RepID=A0A2R8N9E7_CALJA|nr:C-X-C motif chemokine 6 [Callithrix jacchus]